MTPWRVLAAVAGGAALLVATVPTEDGDLPWHLTAGSEIIRERTVTGLGADWSFSFHNDGWTTTQWLSEVTMTAVHDVAGLRGLLLLRVALTALLIISLARLLLRGREAFWGPVVFSLTLLALVPFLQERPQLASLPLLVWLSGLAWRTLHTGEPPPLWWTLAGTCLWANLHGIWVMVPVTLTLLACCALLDRRWGSARTLALTTAASLAAACLTPVGPALLVSPFRFVGATEQIAEWDPTTPRNAGVFAIDLVIVLFVLAWVRSSTSIPGRELLYVLAFVAFSMLAFRNVAPAAILLAPVLVHRLHASFPLDSRADSERERRVLLGAVTVVTLGAILATGLRIAVVDPIGPMLPDDLARAVAADGKPHRVLNDYNVGGAVIHWGRGRVQVAIDGRADYYGGRRITEHLQLLALTPGWRKRLAALDPDRALLRLDSPMTDQLTSQGWTEQARQTVYVLLAKPGT